MKTQRHKDKKTHCTYKFHFSIMAAEGGADTVGINSTIDRKKRIKVKGTVHRLHYEILNDPNIIAESGWEN
ncbi:MAG: hypothetical protein ACYTXY_45695, partial [Nostoc sp.]